MASLVELQRISKRDYGAATSSGSLGLVSDDDYNARAKRTVRQSRRDDGKRVALMAGGGGLLGQGFAQGDGPGGWSGKRYAKSSVKRALVGAGIGALAGVGMNAAKDRVVTNRLADPEFRRKFENRMAGQKSGVAKSLNDKGSRDDRPMYGKGALAGLGAAAAVDGSARMIANRKSQTEKRTAKVIRQVVPHGIEPWAREAMAEGIRPTMPKAMKVNRMIGAGSVVAGGAMAAPYIAGKIKRHRERQR